MLAAWWLPLRGLSNPAGRQWLRHASQRADPRRAVPASQWQRDPKIPTPYSCFVSEHWAKTAAEWRAIAPADRKAYQRAAATANRRSAGVVVARLPPQRRRVSGGSSFALYIRDNFHAVRAKC
eukprot:EG_transcript_46780